MTSQPPFSVRPNPGSALDRIVKRQRENGQGMKRLAHDWAAEHEKREQEARK